jgi:hypothetical protein
VTNRFEVLRSEKGIWKKGQEDEGKKREGIMVRIWSFAQNR